MQKIDAILDKVTKLPPAPKILPKLLKLLSDPDAGSHEIVRLLMVEPALTAQLLRLCNSTVFAGGQKVDDLEEAVVRLGFREVYQLVSAVCCAGMVTPPQKGYGIDRGELWTHSLVAAIAAGVVGDTSDVDPNVAFTAGLLHDLGKIVLSESLTDQYALILDEIENKKLSFLEAERDLLGVQHAEVGGRLLQRWEFSEQLVAGVWHHHDPLAAEGHKVLASVVYLGNAIAHFLGHSSGYHPLALRGQSSALEILHITSSGLDSLIIKTSERLEREAKLLKIEL